MSEPSKVTPAHRRRSAYVYVRQSTLAQVHTNTESLERQYELTRRAHALGWAADQVVVVDEDLGRSGAETARREGFKALVAAVGLGTVGIVLGIEVSRLARRSADWYQLLDLCAITDTLIADAGGIYHPADYNDRLVLGLKGTMSEAELHLLRGRLLAGRQHKAEKGELRIPLPIGYDYDAEDRVVLAFDEATREAVAAVFRKFERLESARQVLVALLQDRVDIPRRRPRGRVEWHPPTPRALHEMLTNPGYAGAFAYGRTRITRRIGADGAPVTRRISYRSAPGEWAVLIKDHHPGYISWAQFEANQARLAANATPPQGEGGGATREGSALLQGLLRCGRCGRMMRVGYSGHLSLAGDTRRGLSSRYVCMVGGPWVNAGRTCQGVGGRQIEHAVVDAVFAALEPAALAATAEALVEAESSRTGRLRVFHLALERTRYDAERARRQYDACEPENRLVARTLEAEWERRLAAVAAAEQALAAEEAYRRARFSPEERAWLERAGADIRAVFDAPTTTMRERKQMLRAVLAEITLTVDRPNRRADLVLWWEGGATTPLTVPLPRLGAPWRRTDDTTIELVRRLAQHYDDPTIAQILGRQHRRTGSGLPYTKSRVAELRHHHGIPLSRPAQPSPAGAESVSIARAAKVLSVGVGTLYRWLADGFIAGEQPTPGAPWQIRLDDDLRAKVADQVPPGWVGLNAAAAALGVTRQTVLHKVQRGELAAVHVRLGRRGALRINVNTEQSELFEPR